MNTIEKPKRMHTRKQQMSTAPRMDSSNNAYELTANQKMKASLFQLKNTLAQLNEQPELNLTLISESRSHLIALLYLLKQFAPFQHLLQNPVCEQAGNRPWLWYSLLRHKELHAGLLAVLPTRAIPLHDHPGAAGMNIVVRGQVNITQYDRPATDRPRLAHTPMLINKQHTLASEGSMTVYNSIRGNIHGLTANGSAALILSIQAPPYQRSKRYWYFPLFEQESNSACLLVRKVHLEMSQAAPLQNTIKEHT